MPTSKTVNLTSNKTKKVRSKKTTSKKAKKVVAPKETVSPKVPVVTVSPPTPVVTVSPPTPVVTSVAVDACETNFETIWSSLNGIMGQIKTLKSDIKTLEKNYKKKVKELKKNGSRRKSDNPNKPKRAPSGFAKPAVISDGLCDFLNKTHGSEMARTEVTKHLTQYIKNHELQNPANRKEIKPDTALKSLLGPLEDKDKDKGYTYFNLQKYMKHHFPKSAKTLALEAKTLEATVSA